VLLLSCWLLAVHRTDTGSTPDIPYEICGEKAKFGHDIFPSTSDSLVHIVPPNSLNNFLRLQTKERPVGFLGLLSRKYSHIISCFKE
jgi:hypothetical protein